MSLRGRLTLLYTSLVGGILLLFGIAIYFTVSTTLTNQIDDLLRRTAEEIYTNARVDSIGQLNVIMLPNLDVPADVFVQVWSRNTQLKAASPNISYLTVPLDARGLQSSVPNERDVTIGNSRYRVLTVPLSITGSDRIVGILQLGIKSDVVIQTQRTLLTVLLIGLVLSISIAGLTGWFAINQALAPLESVTQAALQITRADDLSRRIPYKGSPEDEIGQLINAFNQTLTRLESLFHTQRRFLADVGHELRTPLTVIKGNVGLLHRIGNVDDESLVSIESEVDRLTRLVGDLLLLAQAESGKIPMTKQQVELDTLVLEAMKQMSVLARDKLSLRLGEFDQVQVCGDQDQLKQVVFNLIGNAINYTPAGGEVVVGLGKANKQARLSITDTGPGIPAEDLPHIFERFYRGEKSRTRSRDGKGFGLGLSIAYWIIRNHGGRIEVDSIPGKGTTFCVWLPILDGECPSEN
jgi:two-component system, OmpR family, sensor kinase